MVFKNGVKIYKTRVIMAPVRYMNVGLFSLSIFCHFYPLADYRRVSIGKNISHSQMAKFCHINFCQGKENGLRKRRPQPKFALKSTQKPLQSFLIDILGSNAKRACLLQNSWQKQMSKQQCIIFFDQRGRQFQELLHFVSSC